MTFPEPQVITLTDPDYGRIELSVHEQGTGPAVVFSHGFPELAYSWRHQLPAVAAAGFRAIAPDQRGYGGSTAPEPVAAYGMDQLTGDLVRLLDELGLDYFTFKASGTSEDIAMLMAFNQGASLIVAVGTHSSMVDFLDKGRSGMASTILTRMKVGPILVDAKGVNRLYHSAVRKRDLMLLVAGALAAIIIIIVIVSDPIRLVIHSIWADLTG